MLTLMQSLWPQSDLLLNETLAYRGIEHRGDDTRLSCVRAALERKQRVSLAAVGGSITAGSSYTAGTGGATFLYHNKVIQVLNARFPVAGGHGHHEVGGHHTHNDDEG